VNGPAVSVVVIGISAPSTYTTTAPESSGTYTTIVCGRPSNRLDVSIGVSAARQFAVVAAYTSRLDCCTTTSSGT
jgi:hypothetical protein